MVWASRKEDECMACVAFQVIPRYARGYIHYSIEKGMDAKMHCLGGWDLKLLFLPRPCLCWYWGDISPWCGVPVSLDEGTCGGVMHSRCASFAFLHGKVSPLWVEPMATVLVPFFNPAFTWALVVIQGQRLSHTNKMKSSSFFVTGLDSTVELQSS